MIESFSIELAAEEIYDSRTKEYFQEVLSSYTNGNYRSAVVMLWTVVVCDLIYKLQNLRDIYNDTTAEKILNDIEQRQNKNPKSSDWEAELLDQVKTRTELLDNAEEQNLQNLLKNRHLSAHPVLSQADLLFRPNRETVRSLIRNTLEGVLLKPPILGKKIVTEFVADLAAKQDLLPDDQSLKNYLDARYLRNLRPTIENYLFRELWKFVFQVTNSDTNKNRDINFCSLRIIYARRKNEFKKYIQEHKDFFSKVEEEEPLKYLVDFLSDNPSIYGFLKNDARILIKNSVESDIDLYAIAIFLKDDVNVKEHLEEMRKRIIDDQKKMSDDSWIKLCKIAEEYNHIDLVLDIAVKQYGNSGSFMSAYDLFDTFIEPILDLFDKEHLLKLLEVIESNDQIHKGKYALTDHEKVKKRCDQILGLQFDYSKYPHFKTITCSPQN
ncbi:MAG: hypothetical protein ACLFQP_11330 [Halothece sp.]